MNGAQIRVVYAHGAHAPSRLLTRSDRESAIADVNPRDRTEGARLGSVGANGKRTVHEHVIKQPAHAVREQRLDMLARRKTHVSPCMSAKEQTNRVAPFD